MMLSSLIISYCEDHVLFFAYPFNGSVVFSFELSHQFLPPFSTGVLSEIFLTPCAILSLVTEAVCC